MDKHFEKEFEEAKKRGASQDYIDYIYALSLIDGSHKEHLKVMNEFYKYFDLAKGSVEEKKLIKIIAGKCWVSGFQFAFKNIDKIKDIKKLKEE